MALFTVLLEFDGGTYISQFRAPSVGAAARMHATDLSANEAVGGLQTRRSLARYLRTEVPVAIAGVRNVWCNCATVGGKFALVNIVATA